MNDEALARELHRELNVGPRRRQRRPPPTVNKSNQPPKRARSDAESSSTGSTTNDDSDDFSDRVAPPLTHKSRTCEPGSGVREVEHSTTGANAVGSAHVQAGSSDRPKQTEIDAAPKVDRPITPTLLPKPKAHGPSEVPSTERLKSSPGSRKHNAGGLVPAHPKKHKSSPSQSSKLPKDSTSVRNVQSSTPVAHHPGTAKSNRPTTPNDKVAPQIPLVFKGPGVTQPSPAKSAHQAAPSSPTLDTGVSILSDSDNPKPGFSKSKHEPSKKGVSCPSAPPPLLQPLTAEHHAVKQEAAIDAKCPTLDSAQIVEDCHAKGQSDVVKVEADVSGHVEKESNVDSQVKTPKSAKSSDPHPRAHEFQETAHNVLNKYPSHGVLGHFICQVAGWGMCIWLRAEDAGSRAQLAAAVRSHYPGEAAQMVDSNNLAVLMMNMAKNDYFEFPAQADVSTAGLPWNEVVLHITHMLIESPCNPQL